MRSPSTRRMTESTASQRRAARSATGSSTGWRWVGGAAGARGALAPLFQHRLDVRRRARDDPEDLRLRRLLLEGLAEVAVARLQLLEEADVLDRDDRLGGKGLQEPDLPVGEGPHLLAAHRQDADCGALPHTGHG